MRSFLQFGKKYYIFRTVTSESPKIEFITFIHETGHFLSPFFVTGERIIIPLGEGFIFSLREGNLLCVPPTPWHKRDGGKIHSRRRSERPRTYIYTRTHILYGQTYITEGRFTDYISAGKHRARVVN